MDDDLSDDFELSLAYATPQPIYERLVAQGLARPTFFSPGSAWLDVE